MGTHFLNRTLRNIFGSKLIVFLEFFIFVTQAPLVSMLKTESLFNAIACVYDVICQVNAFDINGADNPECLLNCN